MIATKQSSPAAEQWREIFEAFFRYCSLPEAPVYAMLTTRTFFRAEGEFIAELLRQSEPKDAHVLFGVYPFRRWDMVFNHGTTAKWGVRTCVPTYSPQAVFHESDLEWSPYRSVRRRILMEWDCDLHNPDAGLYHVIQHEIHDVALKRSSDPWRMRTGMMKRFEGLDIPLVGK